MVIAAAADSEFHWNYLGLPAALVNSLYDRVPPIVLTAEGADGAISYAATGLPAGITYDASTGELSGTPTLMGEYPVTVTATDAGDDALITLDFVFVVLPPTGGDVSQITVNFWVTKATLKLGTMGRSRGRRPRSTTTDRRRQPLRPGHGHLQGARLARSVARAVHWQGPRPGLRLQERERRGAGREPEAHARQADPLLVDPERHDRRDRAGRARADRVDR
jgi:hypothetical protein